MDSVAGVRYRYLCKRDKAGVVPSESLLMMHVQAQKAIAYWTGKMGVRPSDCPIMGMKVAGFDLVVEKSHPSFLVKVLGCLRESWREITSGEKTFSLKEGNAFSFILPQESDAILALAGLRSVFVGDKFNPDSARSQAKAELPKLEGLSCRLEFEARLLPCHVVSLVAMLEAFIKDEPVQDAMPMRGLIRLFVPLLMVHLESWAVKKQDLRK